MAQIQERRAKMRKSRRETSDRGSLFALFLLVARFANDRITSSTPGMKAFGPSWCFSAWFRWASRCAQLAQKGGHGPSHLCQREFRTSVFPRAAAAFHQGTSQDQQIVRTGHQLCPAFGALRGREPWSVPEQFLLVEAIAMFVRVTQAVDWADLGQRSRLVAFPDKPADPGITLASAGSMADDLNERKFHPTSGAQVQVVPAE
jgi:hypothetical protein